MPRVTGASGAGSTTNVTIDGDDEAPADRSTLQRELTIDEYDIRSSELARKQRAAITVEPRPEVDESWWGFCDVPIPRTDTGAQFQWNYPLEKRECIQLDGPPAGFDISTLPPGGNVKFYRMEMSDTGEASGRIYEFWIQKDVAGKELNSGWVNRHPLPDFLWIPTPK